MVAAGRRAGMAVDVQHVDNPRVELEEHYYNAKHSKLTELGLDPHLLTDAVLDSMLARAQANSTHVNAEAMMPTIRWIGGEEPLP